jgi:hypothetical protein
MADVADSGCSIVCDVVHIDGAMPMGSTDIDGGNGVDRW